MFLEHGDITQVDDGFHLVVSVQAIHRRLLAGNHLFLIQVQKLRVLPVLQNTSNPKFEDRSCSKSF